MYRFAALYQSIDQTTKTNEKLAAMVGYFADVPATDAAWAVYFLCGNKPRQLVPGKLLRQWAAELADIPDWLFDECYHSVGDLAETLALVVPQPSATTSHLTDSSLTNWVEEKLLPLRDMDVDEQRMAVESLWLATPIPVRLVVMKLITGAFRVGVSKRLVTRALAQASGVAVEVIAHRLMGSWQPTPDFFEQLTSPAQHETLASQPYPFCLAHPLDTHPVDQLSQHLGPSHDYAAEWKWDGIRGQLIRRQGETYIWSRGEELMENRWPELEAAAESLPDGTVLDGEILATNAEGIMPFAALQRRIGRKQLSKKLLTEVPVVFHAFDMLEVEGVDIRNRSYRDRRAQLEQLFDQATFTSQPTSVSAPMEGRIQVTQLLPATQWSDWATLRSHSRQHNAEGLMLKRLDAPYDVGRVRGTWWKWKIEPYTIDAVLIYAQKGHGKRANLFTDYTFALWQGEELVPFAKAYSGLDDAEIRQVDRFVRQNTRESFGPVRSVTPSLVMELAFEGLQPSSRHKSGIATRFPRIVRWRHDKRPQDANTLDELKALLPTEGDGA